MTTPFIIYALPRSRTAWLSAFLTYREWHCYHEHAVFMRSMDDVVRLFSQPNVGAAETAAAPGWYLIQHRIPNIRTVVIRRKVDDSVRSMMTTDVPGIRYAEERVRKGMIWGERILEKISREVPGALTLWFDELATEEGCRAVFEHCLPYRFDRLWWQAFKDQNIQVSVADYVRYYYAHEAELLKFKRDLKRELWQLRRNESQSHALV